MASSNIEEFAKEEICGKKKWIFNKEKFDNNKC